MFDLLFEIGCIATKHQNPMQLPFEHVPDVCRRDKYERDLKEYWVDTATTGTFENEHEESLVDRTSTDGIATGFDLGLPAAPPSAIEDQGGDESEAESTSANEAPSVRSKVPKPDELDNEPVLEAPFKTR